MIAERSGRDQGDQGRPGAAGSVLVQPKRVGHLAGPHPAEAPYGDVRSQTAIGPWSRLPQAK